MSQKVNWGKNWEHPEKGVSDMGGGGAEGLCRGRGEWRPHLDLALPHDPVCALAILLGDFRFVVTLFIAQYPQGLGAFQLDLEFLKSQERRKVPHEQTGPTASLLPQKDPCLKTLSTSVLR